MDSFVNNRNNELKYLKESNDLEFLKKELVKTEQSMPECAAESFFRTNKLCIIRYRISQLSM